MRTIHVVFFVLVLALLCGCGDDGSGDGGSGGAAGGRCPASDGERLLGELRSTGYVDKPSGLFVLPHPDGWVMATDGRDLFPGGEEVEGGAVVVWFDASGAVTRSALVGSGDGLMGLQGGQTDAEGNLYLTGTLLGPLAFGGELLEPADAGEPFVVALSPAGEVRWATLVPLLGSRGASGLHLVPGEVWASARFEDGEPRFGWLRVSSDDGEVLEPVTLAPEVRTFSRVYGSDTLRLATIEPRRRATDPAVLIDGVEVPRGERGGGEFIAVWESARGAGDVDASGPPPTWITVIEADGSRPNQALFARGTRDGGALLGGRYTGTLQLDGESLELGEGASFLVRLDSEGALSWWIKGASGAQDVSRDVLELDDGRLLVAVADATDLFSEYPGGSLLGASVPTPSAGGVVLLSASGEVERADAIEVPDGAGGTLASARLIMSGDQPLMVFEAIEEVEEVTPRGCGLERAPFIVEVRL